MEFEHYTKAGVRTDKALSWEYDRNTFNTSAPTLATRGTYI